MAVPLEGGPCTEENAEVIDHKFVVCFVHSFEENALLVVCSAVDALLFLGTSFWSGTYERYNALIHCRTDALKNGRTHALAVERTYCI